MFHSTITRLFFALRPSPVLARQIEASAAVLHCRTLASELLHITLFILDDAATPDPALVARLREVGDAVRAAPVAITLDRLVASYRSTALRPGRTSAALQALYDQLAGLTRETGIAGREDHRFSPHMTLGYHRGEPWSERVAPVGWTADELLLIHSHVGRTRTTCWAAGR